jgi:nucleotide-binding universal stress UspA family protein
MFIVHKILVPLVFTDTSRHIVQQAAWLARRFNAEIILLHVVTPLGYPAGMLEGGHEITARDLHAHIVQRVQQDLDQTLPEFDGIAVARIMLRGDPAREICGDRARPERRPDRDVDSWPWAVLSVSAGIGNGEGAAR